MPTTIQRVSCLALPIRVNWLWVTALYMEILREGFCLLEICFKTEVYQLARHLKIPHSILKREATAELKKNQKDEDDLPSYKILDPVLRKLIEKEEDPDNLFEKKIFKWIINSEFKRRQSPPILKIKDRSFDRGWRWPLSMKFFF